MGPDSPVHSLRDIPAWRGAGFHGERQVPLGATGILPVRTQMERHTGGTPVAPATPDRSRVLRRLAPGYNLTLRSLPPALDSHAGIRPPRFERWHASVRLFVHSLRHYKDPRTMHGLIMD